MGQDTEPSTLRPCPGLRARALLPVTLGLPAPGLGHMSAARYRGPEPPPQPFSFCSEAGCRSPQEPSQCNPHLLLSLWIKGFWGESHG